MRTHSSTKHRISHEPATTNATARRPDDHRMTNRFVAQEIVFVSLPSTPNPGQQATSQQALTARREKKAPEQRYTNYYDVGI